jgi:hypothetical protein
MNETQIANLQEKVSSIDKKLDALIKATTAMAEAVIQQIKSDVVVKEKMEKYFSEEIRLLGLEEEDRKTKGTEADSKY